MREPLNNHRVMVCNRQQTVCQPPGSKPDHLLTREIPTKPLYPGDIKAEREKTEPMQGKERTSPQLPRRPGFCRRRPHFGNSPSEALPEAGVPSRATSRFKSSAASTIAASTAGPGLSGLGRSLPGAGASAGCSSCASEGACRFLRVSGSSRGGSAAKADRPRRSPLRASSSAVGLARLSNVE